MTVITLLFTPLVQAHTGMHGPTGFADGFMHPATGPAYLLIAVTAGIWAGRSGNHGVPDVMYFLALLLGGMLLGGVCLAFPQLQLSIYPDLALAVAVIAMSIAAPQYISYFFFGGLAVYQGIVHMLNMPSPVAGLHFGAGLLVSTGLLALF